MQRPPLSCLSSFYDNVNVPMCRKQQPLFPVKYNLDLPESQLLFVRWLPLETGFWLHPARSVKVTVDRLEARSCQRD